MRLIYLNKNLKGRISQNRVLLEKIARSLTLPKKVSLKLYLKVMSNQKTTLTMMRINSPTYLDYQVFQLNHYICNIKKTMRMS